MRANDNDRLRDLTVVIGATALLLLSGCASLSGGPTGIVNGELQPCPPGPHCVSSDDTRPSFRIAPLQVIVAPAVAWRGLKAHVASLPRTEIAGEHSGYLHLTFTSRWLRFTDDVEFLLRADRGEIAVRSSSRLGYYDFGVNRERLESIRAALRSQELIK
jgi:uncharacterized protein (DUF1499 family)